MTTAETRALKIRVSQIIFRNPKPISIAATIPPKLIYEPGAEREPIVHADLESSTLKGTIEVQLLPEEQAALDALMRQIEQRLEADF